MPDGCMWDMNVLKKLCPEGTTWRTNKEFQKEYKAEYYKKNREKILEQKKEYSKREDVREKKRKYMKIYSSRPEIKQRYKMLKIEKTYGLSEEDFKTLLSDQESMCGICGTEFTEDISLEKRSHSPHVDHCHTSGEVRGLLCVNCNAGLGQFKDSVKILLSAVEYLQ